MAYTGFLVNEGGGNPICADTSQHAIDALGARFPYLAGSQPILCNMVSSVFASPNSFTNTLLCHDLTSGQSWQLSHSLTLMSCDPAEPIGGNYGIHTQAEYVAAGELIFSALASVWVLIWTYRKIAQVLHWGRGDAE